MPPALSAVRADITSLRVDAVVNAANSRLAGGGGVDGAIHRAAGRADLMSACAALGGCEPGEAKATPGFRLPARWIIHTVGPVWQGGHQGEPDVLARCYVASMQVADQLGARSVAFPAISTGIYGFPKDLAATIAVNTLRRSASAAQQVILVAFDEEMLRMYESRLSGDR